MRHMSKGQSIYRVSQRIKAHAKLVIVVPLLILLAVSFSLVQHSSQQKKASLDDCFVGVAFCGDTAEEAKLLIDKVKDYTNLFILQSGPISKNETATNEICDYAVTSGLHLIVYFGDLNPRVLSNQTMWRIDWVNNTAARWGDKLLGVYYYDEPGGIYLDTDWTKYQSGFMGHSYDSVAQRFINGFQRDRGTVLLKANSIPIFVSDYALYWFDYLAGYDVVLAQVGWNHSYAQDIALVRGAATMQGKEWGIIVTWKYDEPPYLDSGEAIYEQMATAYRSGAKYIAVFNYPKLDGNQFGVLKEEHFDALKRFWNNAARNRSLISGSIVADAALVLPKNYGWGLRHSEDRIWGFWGPDEKSSQIWNISRYLLSEYGYNLDIVFGDEQLPINDSYKEVYFWNSQILSAR